MPKTKKRTGKSNNPNGRPTVYKITYPNEAEKLCHLGATDEEIADFFDVDVATIYRWKNRYIEFCEALKAGKDYADERVERSLYQRAIGCSHPEHKVFNDGGKPLIVPTRKYHPPDTTAAIFWLKNRRRDDWRDRRDIGLSLSVQDMSDDELDVAIAQLDEKAGGYDVTN